MKTNSQQKNQKSRTDYAMLNSATNVFGFFLTTALGFVSRLFFVKYLTVDYLGLNGLFTNIISVLSLTELGIGAAITYALYSPLAKNENEKVAALVSYFSKIYKIIGLVVAGLGLCVIPFLDTIIGSTPDIKESTTWIYLVFLFSASVSYFFSHKLSLLRAAQQDYIVTGYSYVTTVLQVVIQIIVLVYTQNYLYFLYIQVGFGLVYLIWISVSYKRQYAYLRPLTAQNLSKSDKKELYTNVWALSVQRLGGVLVNSTDNILISYLVNIASVGLLSNYLLLTKVFESLFGNLMISVTAGIGNFNSLEKKEDTKKLFDNLQFMMFLIYGWVTVGIIVMAGDVIEFLFGSDYRMSKNIAVILGINFYMVGMQSVLWTFRSAMGLFNYKKYILLVTALINLVLSYLLGIYWGVFGVLLATAIARLFTNWWWDPVVLFVKTFETKLSFYFKTYFYYLFILIAIVLLTEFVVSFLKLDIIRIVIFKFIFCSIIFWLGIFLLFRNKEETSFVIQKTLQIKTLISGYLKK